jgi:hypothetical protein
MYVAPNSVSGRVVYTVSGAPAALLLLLLLLLLPSPPAAAAAAAAAAVGAATVKVTSAPCECVVWLKRIGVRRELHWNRARCCNAAAAPFCLLQVSSALLVQHNVTRASTHA